jgi:multisubunit Na+/H+ antiporter MnhG subunit
VGPIAIGFGVALTILGIVLYRTSEPEHQSLTALIPSVFGLALVLCGQIARGTSEKARMHAMHVAAMIGLIGLIGGIVLVVLDVQKFGGEQPPSTRALAGKAALAVLCGVFVGWCVKSFIDARRARKRNAAGAAPTTDIK